MLSATSHHSSFSHSDHLVKNNKTHLVRRVRWLWGSCTRPCQPAACSACPPGPGKPWPGPWRTPRAPRTLATSETQQLPAEEPCVWAEQTEPRSGWTARSSSASAAPPVFLHSGRRTGVRKENESKEKKRKEKKRKEKKRKEKKTDHIRDCMSWLTCSETGSSGKYGMFLAHSMVLKRSRAASSQMLSMPMTEPPLADVCICAWLYGAP